MELFRALAVFSEPPNGDLSTLTEVLELGEPPGEDEYTDLFLFQLYPYASVYLGPEGMLGGEARDRIAGFWRAIGETPPNEPDHLALILAMYAQLAEQEHQASTKEQTSFWHNARAAFLWEHVLTWLPFYLDKLETVASPFYRRWGSSVRDAILEEARRGDLQNSVLPLHLREATGLADPRIEGVDQFLDSLLAPIRSGFIMTRTDLARAARELTLGSRIAERKYALRAMMEQDAGGVLKWLSTEAAKWGDKHAAHLDALGVVAEFWVKRANRAAELLAELAREGATMEEGRG